MKNKLRINAKVLLISLASILLVFSIVGGSIAWLMTKTETITNTFTYGDISITLTEEHGTSFKMTPGATLVKDPMLTVAKDSEACWLFVKIDESSDKALDDFITYELADGWSALTGVTGVYFRKVDTSSNDQEFYVLKDNKVTVKSNVTKEMLAELNTSNYPTLSFTGYAVQRDENITDISTAEKAWDLVKNIGV